MRPSSTTLLTVATAASLVLGPALATGSSQPDPDISRWQNLNSDGPVHWQQSQDAAAHADQQVSHETRADEEESADGRVPGDTVIGSTLTSEPQQSDSWLLGSEGTPLDWQPELKRSEDGGEERRRVLMRRETSAAATIYGVSIWLILAWVALLYLMYKTGSL
ncbi:hypothetical protein DHEL01_v204890 [Diaporthe helianthi]|uniref:Transmembrane protein n=1 Tax=Diaporthe helianthi TaxID=158607 RepID=A0A2P5I2J1_DIAHE|nr:hypothetical protein DHEL01_v204890 [Diaporthe helianthi]